MTAARDVGNAAKQGFLDAMRRHAAGVCVVTVGSGEAVNGMAATAVASFSADPPSLLVCFNGSASIAGEFRPGMRFGVTVLARRHEEVVRAFSRKPSGRARFADRGWRFEEDNCPWLDDAVANLACEVRLCTAYATRNAVIGEVASSRLGPDGPSLIYRDGMFR